MRIRLLVVLLCCVVGLSARGAAAQSIESKPLGVPAVSPGASRATTPTSLGSAALRTGVSLAAVLVLIGGTAITFKHLAKKGVLPASLGTGARAPSGLLDVLARYPVGGGQSLLVLKFDRRILLVCQSAAKGLRRGNAGMTPLCELTEPEDVASVLLKVRGDEQAAMAEKFQKMLAGEDSAAERALRAPSPRAVPVPARAHEKARRPAGVASSELPAASAGAIRSRLAAMRQQPQPVPAAQPRAVMPRAGRAEFVG